MAELDRISRAEDLKDPPIGVGVVRYQVICQGSAFVSLERVKEALSSVLRLGSWEAIEGKDPNMVLPRWFVDMCGEELSSEERIAWLEKWRKLSDAERTLAEDQRRWSVNDWLYWFEDEQRAWFWRRAQVLNENEYTVDIEVIDWPFPSGALRWLLVASGAKHVTEIGFV